MYRQISIFCCAVVLLAYALPSHGQSVDFEDLGLPPNSFNNNSNGFMSAGVGFNNSYNSSWGSWAGWAYSTTTDTTTPGYLNQYSAITGGGFSGSATYAVSYEDFYTPFIPIISLPDGLTPQSVRITNTTYSYLSMVHGDSFAKQFGGISGDDPDYFKLTITGKDDGGVSTGTVEFYLADFRFANNAEDYIVDDWELLDLTALSNMTKTLEFNLETSDVGMYGANTPFYVAIDDLILAPASLAVPEPSSLLIVVICVLAYSLFCIFKLLV